VTLAGRGPWTLRVAILDAGPIVPHLSPATNALGSGVGAARRQNWVERLPTDSTVTCHPRNVLSASTAADGGVARSSYRLWVLANCPRAYVLAWTESLAFEAAPIVVFPDIHGSRRVRDITKERS
jgi:hypothetical protein